MKATTAGLILGIVASGIFALGEFQKSARLSQQVSDYGDQISQLLSDIESNSIRNIQTDKQLQALQSDLRNSELRIAALSGQLDLAQQKVDPDYEQVETRLREQLSRELQASDLSSTADPIVTVLQQLSELDPMVMGEIMALNAEYGDFLKSLNVSEERKEIIINALHNMIATRNQAMSEIVMEMQNNPDDGNRRDLRQQMQALHDPQAQREALSYELTDSELDALTQFQEQRQGATFSMSTGAGVSVSPAFIGGGVIRGQGQSGAIQLIPAVPNN